MGTLLSFRRHLDIKNDDDEKMKDVKFDLLVVFKVIVGEVMKFSRLHLLSTTNVCTKFHDKMSNSCCGILVWTKVVLSSIHFGQTCGSIFIKALKLLKSCQPFLPSVTSSLCCWLLSHKSP